MQPPQYPPSPQPNFPPPPPTSASFSQRFLAWWNKNNANKAILIGVVALLLVCGCVAASPGSKSGTTTKQTSDGTSAPAATNTPKPVANGRHKVGEAIKEGDWEVTVNGVKTDPGGQFDTLKDGDIFVFVDVSITNTSSTSQNFSSLLQTSFKDSTGQEYNETFASDSPASPNEGAIASGDITRGTIVYEVPKAQQAFIFSFKSDAFGSSQSQWDLSV